MLLFDRISKGSRYTYQSFSPSISISLTEKKNIFAATLTLLSINPRQIGWIFADVSRKASGEFKIPSDHVISGPREFGDITSSCVSYGREYSLCAGFVIEPLCLRSSMKTRSFHRSSSLSLFPPSNFHSAVLFLI